MKKILFLSAAAFVFILHCIIFSADPIEVMKETIPPDLKPLNTLHDIVAMRRCQENLAKLDGAKEQWALDNNKKAGEQPKWEELIGNTGYILEAPVCPRGGIYFLNPIGKDPVCTHGLLYPGSFHSLSLMRAEQLEGKVSEPEKEKTAEEKKQEEQSIQTDCEMGGLKAPDLKPKNYFQDEVAARICRINLSKLDGAKENWALDNNKGASDVVTLEEICGPNLYLQEIPKCPRGGKYYLDVIGKDPVCSHGMKYPGSKHELP